jgi:hypothetical protein
MLSRDSDGTTLKNRPVTDLKRPNIDPMSICLLWKRSGCINACLVAIGAALHTVRSKKHCPIGRETADDHPRIILGRNMRDAEPQSAALSVVCALASPDASSSVR